MSMELLNGVTHLCHSSVRIERGKIVYLDPFQIEGKPQDADLVFCTHDHHDHLSTGDILKVITPETVIVAPQKNVKTFKKLEVGEVVGVEPNREYEAGGVKFVTVPAYNLDKKFHKRKKKYVGYIIYMDNIAYYFAGDTDYVPEMDDINAHVVFMPVGGTYTCGAEDAAHAVNNIKPKIAVPIHFDSLVGSKTDAQTFIDNLDDNIKGVILLEPTS